MQIYEVFIENTLLVFTENEKKQNLVNSVSAGDWDTIDIQGLNYLKKHEQEVLFVISEKNMLQSDFDRLFRNFKKVIAAGGVVRKKDEFLFIHRNGYWDLPKGKMEAGEVPEETALREVEEECGIHHLELGSLIVLTYHCYFFKEKWHFKTNYWYTMTYHGDEPLIPQLEEGIDQVEWLNKEQLDRVYACTFPSIIKVLDSYFKK